MKHQGSIISGTMRLEDLIPAFLDRLESSRPMKRSTRTITCAIRTSMDQDGYYDSEQADYDLDSLFALLDGLAPPYWYFGSHPGDGADYGWWLAEDAIQQIKDDGAVIYGQIPKGYEGMVLDVNDRGNITLYWKGRRRPLKELWSVV